MRLSMPTVRGVRSWGLVLLVSAVALVAGCKKTGKEAKTDRPAVGTPNPKGEYEYHVKLPDRYACRSDADCGYTQLRPGNCCPNQCDPEPGSKAWIQAVRNMHYATCREWNRKYGFSSCPKPHCPPPKGWRPKPRCVEGKCTLVFRPVPVKVRWKTVPSPRLKDVSAARQRPESGVVPGPK